MRKISTILAVFLNKNEINDTLLRTPNSLLTVKLNNKKKKVPRKKKILKETKYNEFEDDPIDQDINSAHQLQRRSTRNKKKKVVHAKEEEKDNKDIKDVLSVSEEEEVKEDEDLNHREMVAPKHKKRVKSMRKRKKDISKLTLNPVENFTETFGIRKKSMKGKTKENIKVMDIYELDAKQRAEKADIVKNSSRYLHDISEEDTSRNMLNQPQEQSRRIHHEEFLKNVEMIGSENDLSGYYDLLRSLTPPVQSKQRVKFKQQNKDKE